MVFPSSSPELKKILPNILHQIGFTPIVKLNKIPQSLGIECDVCKLQDVLSLSPMIFLNSHLLLLLDAKCEFLNPGGSVKDRIGYRMLLDAEEKGLIGNGSTIIEATSGNTGIGVALACAVRGYPCIIVMAEKNSNEKVDTLKLLGATIIRTPTEAGFLHPQGIFAVSQDLRRRIPNAVIFGQYSNPGNYLAHYDGTGSEILWQFDNDLDMVVVGAGTGGTVSGLGKKIKEECSKCKVVSFDPFGSILARPETLNVSDVTFFEVEGIGYDFIPTVLKHEFVDEWHKTADPESFQMARRLCKEEGLLCGGSSGAALSVALKAAKSLKAGQKCCVILPDGIRNYMTKFVNDSWCQARGFMPLENTHELWWWNDLLQDLKLATVETVPATMLIKAVLEWLDEKQVQHVPVVDETGAVLGITDRKLILDKCFQFGYAMDAPVKIVMEKTYPKVQLGWTLARVAAVLRNEPFACVTEELARECGKARSVVKHVVTSKELLNYVAAGPKEEENKLNGK